MKSIKLRIKHYWKNTSPIKPYRKNRWNYYQHMNKVLELQRKESLKTKG